MSRYDKGFTIVLTAAQKHIGHPSKRNRPRIIGSNRTDCTVVTSAFLRHTWTEGRATLSRSPHLNSTLVGASVRFIPSLGVATFLLSLPLAAVAAPITGQIALAGYLDALGSSGVGAATGLDFVQGASGTASPGVPGGINSYGAGTGSFVGLTCANSGGTCGIEQDILSFATSAPISSQLIFTSGAITISFDLNTITAISRTSDSNGGSVTLTASGIIHETNFDNTAGVLSLTTQGNQITSFSERLTATSVPVVTPEPSSLALLATGLGGVVGFMRRRLS